MEPPISLAAREGFESPGAEAFYWQPVWHLELFGVDLSINRTILTVFVGTLILAAAFLIAFRRPSIRPRGLQNVMEFIISFVRDQIVMPAMGPKGVPYLPYLVTLFSFILVMNLFEVVPGVNFPPTSRFGIPLVLALISYVLFVHAGIRSQGAGHYFKDSLFPPGVPAPLYVLLTPIELVSTFVVRPLTLAIRLMANMIAGHLLLTVLFLGTAYLYGSPQTFGFGIIAMLAGAIMVGFEIFVAGLQAFIFTMLTAVYIAGSLEPAH